MSDPNSDHVQDVVRPEVIYDNLIKTDPKFGWQMEYYFKLFLQYRGNVPIWNQLEPQLEDISRRSKLAYEAAVKDSGDSLAKDPKALHGGRRALRDLAQEAKNIMEPLNRAMFDWLQQRTDEDFRKFLASANRVGIPWPQQWVDEMDEYFVSTSKRYMEFVDAVEGHCKELRKSFYKYLIRTDPKFGWQMEYLFKLFLQYRKKFPIWKQLEPQLESQLKDISRRATEAYGEAINDRALHLDCHAALTRLAEEARTCLLPLTQANDALGQLGEDMHFRNRLAAANSFGITWPLKMMNIMDHYIGLSYQRHMVYLDSVETLIEQLGWRLHDDDSVMFDPYKGKVRHVPDPKARYDRLMQDSPLFSERMEHFSRIYDKFQQDVLVWNQLVPQLEDISRQATLIFETAIKDHGDDYDSLGQASDAIRDGYGALNELVQEVESIMEPLKTARSEWKDMRKNTDFRKIWAFANNSGIPWPQKWVNEIGNYFYSTDELFMRFFYKVKGFARALKKRMGSHKPMQSLVDEDLQLGQWDEEEDPFSQQDSDRQADMSQPDDTDDPFGWL